MQDVSRGTTGGACGRAGLDCSMWNNAHFSGALSISRQMARARSFNLEVRNRSDRGPEFSCFRSCPADLFHVEHKASLRFNANASKARETEFTQSALAPLRNQEAFRFRCQEKSETRDMSCVRNGYLMRLPSNKNRCSDLGTATGSDQVHSGWAQTCSKSRPPSHSSACPAAI